MTAHEGLPGEPHPRRSAESAATRQVRRSLSCDAVCHVHPDSCEVLLTLTHDGPDSAPVVVFSYANELIRPAHVDVSGRTDLRLPAPHGRYDLAVVGPSGFRRAYHGLVGTDVGAQVSAQPRPTATQLRLLLHNRGTDALSYTLTPRDYAAQRDAVSVSVAPRMTRTLTWEVGQSHGWYDVDVSVVEDPSFSRRLTGYLAPVQEDAFAQAGSRTTQSSATCAAPR